MAAARLWEKEPVNFNKTLAKIETLLDEDKLDQILALALELGFNAAWLAPAKAAPPISEQSARSTTQTAMAASSDMVCAAPLGPVDCYEWFHEGWASAELFLEKTVPFRIFFRTFDGHGVVQSESGWHDNLKRTWGLSNNRWAASPHLFGTLRHALLELDSLEFMQIPMGESPQATKTLNLAWTLTAKLAWSMSKESAPPNCYSEILQPGAVFAAVRQTNADKMKTHHENVLSLELARHNFADAAEVWEACLFLNMAPIRLMFEYYRRDKYSAMSPDGKHLMMGMQATLADNKIVEDVHAPLRLASKGNNNDKLAAVTIQDVINHSRVMEQRTINHNVAVSKETFIRDFKGTAIKSQTAGHNFARCHRGAGKQISNQCCQLLLATSVGVLAFEVGRQIGLGCILKQC